MIREVSETLVDVIEQATPDLGSWVELSSLSAADNDPTARRLAIALYAVEPHPHLVNRPLVSSPAGYVRAPLALRLHYLACYIGDHDEAQSRLARVVSVFHTTPIIGPAEMSPTLAQEVATLTVRLVTTTADERNQIWGALGRSARLALFYDVDVAPVDLIAHDGAGAVQTHRIDYVAAT
ncbi:MAG: Pvc16 family protein [Acidimicrobiales bacterium]